MRKLSKKCWIVFIVGVLSIVSHLLWASDDVIIEPPPLLERQGTLFLLSGKPYREPRQYFITLESMQAYYRKLLAALTVRIPEDDVKQAVQQGRYYFIIAASFGEENLFEPDIEIEHYYDELRRKVCPERSLEGYSAMRHADFRRLERIRSGKEAVPKTGTLLDQAGDFYEQGPMLEYSQAVFEYAQRWNRAMKPHCFKKIGVPDINNLPPVQSKHEIVGDVLFVLDEPSFRGKSDTIYLKRLKEVLRKKNPTNDARKAIEEGKFNLLANNHTIHVDCFSNCENVSRKVYTLYWVTNLIDKVAIPYRADDLLKRVCPPKIIEGDGKAPNGDPISEFAKYAVEWNKLMLPYCVKRLKKDFHNALLYEFYIAQHKWSDLDGRPAYQYKASANKLPSEAVTVTVDRHQIVSVIDGQGGDVSLKARVVTIHELFQIIERSIEKRIRPIEVKYDQQYGYPASVLIGKPDNKASYIDYKITNLKLN